MPLNQALSDGKSQAGALFDASGGLSRLAKLLKDQLLIFRPNTDASITDRNTDQVTSGALNSHRSPFRSELQGIAQQVVQDLLESYPVRIHGKGFLGVFDANLFGHRERAYYR